MIWLRKLAWRLVEPFRRWSGESELDEEELRTHIEIETEEYLRKVMPSEEARVAALGAFDGVEQIKEISRDRRSLPIIEAFFQDIRFGLRMFAKSLGFSAVAITVLALGIGANTAIFSVVWRPMRYWDPERLLMVWETSPDGSRSFVSAPTYLDWRDQNRCFERLAAVRRASAALSGNPPTVVSATNITENFCDTFRLRPESGRFFSAADFLPDAARVALLGHDLWQTQFGGDPAVLGKTIRLNGEPYAVIGVAPADFEFWGRMDVWLPLALPGRDPDRQTRDLLVVGRMRSGVSAAGVREEMRVLASRIAQQSPQTNERWSALAQNFYEALAGPGVNLMMVLLFAVVSTVLLVACTNVANLLLARASMRQKEIAVRIALGASRGRVMRQLLAETLLLALMGGAIGVLLALAAVRYLATLPVLQAPGLAPIEINQVVLGFAWVLCLAAAVLSGLVPAWRTTTANLMERLKASGRMTLGDHEQSRLRHGLVTAELALSVMLMALAGLGVRGFIRLAQVDPGFPSKGLLTARLSLPAPPYAGEGRVRMFYSELLERMRGIPGSEDVAISTGLPPMTFELRRPFRVEGRDPAQAAGAGVANYQVVSGGYFRTLGLALLKGRGLNENDRWGSAAVVVINHRLAEKYFPASDPIGRRLVVSEPIPGHNDPSEPVALEIVGVVSDVKNSGLNELASPEVYVSYLQAPWNSEYLVVRSVSRTESLVPAIRDAVRAIDPDLPMTEIATMDERFSQSLAGGRVVVALMAIFALMALLMGSVGLYGVVSYSVGRRSNEFALRMALGASRTEIFRLVGGGAMQLMLIGGAFGLALALGAARLLGSIIFGISPFDPLTFTTVALILLTVVVAASYLPARRAMKVDPIVALREE